MAYTDLRADSALVITKNHFPPAASALIAARLLNKHSPGEIAAAIDILIDVLDLTDGDTDLEETGAEDSFTVHHPDGPGCPVADSDYCTAHDDNPGKMLGDFKAGDPDDAESDGDEQDGNCSEDDFMRHLGTGPGCPVSDPGGGADDDVESSQHGGFI